MAWVSDLGPGGLRERLLGSRLGLATAFKAFECVLSEGFAMGRERWLPGILGGGWVLCMAGFEACACLKGCACGMSKRRASGGCLGARRR